MSLPYDYTSNGLIPGAVNSVDPLFFAWALQTLIVSNSPIIGLYQYSAPNYTLVQTLNASCSVSQNGGQVILTCTATDNSNATYTFNTAVLLIPQFSFSGNTVSWVVLYGTGSALSNYTKSSSQSVQVSLQLTIST